MPIDLTKPALPPTVAPPTIQTLPSGGGSTFGGVVIQSNSQIDRQKADEEAARAAAQAEAQKLDEISGHIQKCWMDAKRAKSLIELELLRDLRQRNGEYEPDIKAKIELSGGSDRFDEFTETICAAGVAWIQDLLIFQPNSKPYTVTATPVPTLPTDVMSKIMAHVANEAIAFEQSGAMVTPQQVEEYKEQVIKSVRQAIMEESRERADRMSKKIEDVISESGWEDALKQFLEDFMTFRAAHIERMVRRVKEIEFDDSQGITLANVTEKEKIVFEAFSPFDAYPSNDASNPNEGFFIRRVFLSRGEVKAMKGMDGYSDANIDYVIENWATGKSTATAPIDGERARLEGKQDLARPHGDNNEALKFWGSVTGKMLLEWAPDGKVDGQTIDKDKDYQIAAIFIGGRTIKAKLNPDPLGRRPIYKACYRNIPGAYWGKGAASLVRNSQTEINSLARAKDNNVGFASMPMMGVDTSKLPAGMSITKLYPGITIPFENRDGQTSRIIEYYQPALFADKIENLLQQAYRRGEDRAGIPPYQYGQEKTAGAGSTLGGLQILQNGASRGIKSAIGNIDTDVIKPIIRDVWVHLMIFDQDEDIKGDVTIQANGAMAQFSKEAITMRRIDLMNATNNPTDAQIKGILGRAKELREAYKATGLDPTGIVPEDDELKAKMQPPQPPPGAAMPPQPGEVQA